MNSTTGDFSKIKSSLNQEIYNRGTQSSVKGKAYLPQKRNIRPLNFNSIKKELEECCEEEEKQGTVVNSYKDDANVQSNVRNLEETAIPPDLQSISTQGILTDISNKNKTTNKPLALEPVREPEEDVQTNNYSSSKLLTDVKETRLVPCVRKNDSFDLNFSVLSLSSPIKKNEVSCSTPIANSNLNVVKENPVEKFDQFVTPKINHFASKTQYSLSKARSVKTPINYLNSISAKKLSNINSSINNKPLSSRKILPIQSANVIKNIEEQCSEEANALKEKCSTSTNSLIINNKPISSSVEDQHRNEETQCCVLRNNIKDDTFKRIKVKNVEYLVLNLLGIGGSSEVFQCYSVENKYHVAVKCVSLQNPATANGYINEVKLLQQLQTCDKIIKMYDYEILEAERKLLVVLEKGGDDLSTVLKKLAAQKSHIPMYMLLFYWMEMLYAVKQIHSHGVIHSDLKPANFLKADGGLKLIDFGIASSVQTDMTSVIKTKPEGSCNYISPEALNNDSSINAENQNTSSGNYKLHYKSDVWSLGCILYQFVYRRTPFQHIAQLWSKLATIMNPQHNIEYPAADWVSPKIISTIQKCLQYNVKSRPSVDELIAEYELILHNV